MLSKYYNIAYIRQIPLFWLGKLLNYAYDREAYERWLQIYPLMEAKILPFINFVEYKEKIIANNTKNNCKMTDKEIMDEMAIVIEKYEKKQQKAGDTDGNI